MRVMRVERVSSERERLRGKVQFRGRDFFEFGSEFVRGESELAESVRWGENESVTIPIYLFLDLFLNRIGFFKTLKVLLRIPRFS